MPSYFWMYRYNTSGWSTGLPWPTIDSFDREQEELCLADRSSCANIKILNIMYIYIIQQCSSSSQAGESHEKKIQITYYCGSLSIVIRCWLHHWDASVCQGRGCQLFETRERRDGNRRVRVGVGYPTMAPGPPGTVRQAPASLSCPAKISTFSFGSTYPHHFRSMAKQKTTNV